MNNEIIGSGDECPLEYEETLGYGNNQAFDDQEYIKFLEFYIDYLDKALDYYRVLMERSTKEELDIEELFHEIEKQKWRFKNKKNNRKIIKHMEKVKEEELSKAFAPCLVCGKDVNLLWPDLTASNLDEATCFHIYGGYGSKYDLDEYKAIVCDSCLENAIAKNRAIHVKTVYLDEV